MNNKKRAGKIDVICGSMFSGKTEELIRRVLCARVENKKVEVFKPVEDCRYSDNCVVSHKGNIIQAHPINRQIDILLFVRPETEVVAIDEAQFFDENIVEICDILANRGCHVIVAGLDLDFRGNAFKNMAFLMSQAENITKLKTVCNVCGIPAWCSQRLVNGEPAFYEDDTIKIGASESYEARCREHHEVIRKENNASTDFFYSVVKM